LRVSSYLLFLVLGCFVGAGILFFGVSQLDRTVERRLSTIHELSVARGDFSRFEDTLSEWLVTSDLILGSGETYLVAGAEKQSTRLGVLLQSLESSVLAGISDAPLADLSRFVVSQNRRLTDAQNASGDQRYEHLNRLLAEMDEESVRAILSLQTVGDSMARMEGKASAAYERARHDRLSWLLTLSISYILYVFFWWRWAGVRLSQPVQRLSESALVCVRDGREFTVDTVGPSEVQDLSASFGKLVSTLEDRVRDRTEHLSRANEELARAQQRLTHLASFPEANPNAVFEVSLDGDVTYMNPAARQRFPGLEEAGPGHPAVRTSIELMGPEHLSGQETVDDVFANDNDVFERKITYLPSSHVARVFLADVTEIHRAQESLTRSKEMAEAANSAKSEFLANMTHELRTPLNGVIGFTDLLLQTDLEEEQLDYARTARDSGKNLLAVISDILDFSKIEAGKLEVEHSPVDVLGAIESLAEQSALTASSQGIELIVHYDTDAPTTIDGDHARLVQIATNLVSNALKFTDAGHVLIHVENDRCENDAPALKISVTDTGCGIPESRIAAIFESFTQADNSSTRRHGGTGLGLSISKQLAGLMGGEIGLSSEPGKGSTFWFTVPAESGSGAVRSESNEATTLDGVRVLAIVPNKTASAALRDTVCPWGVELVECPDVASGQDRLLEDARVDEIFDYVLLDSAAYSETDFPAELAQDLEGIGTQLVVLSNFCALDTSGVPFRSHQLSKPVKRSHLEQLLRGEGSETLHPTIETSTNRVDALELPESRGAVVDLVTSPAGEQGVDGTKAREADPVVATSIQILIVEDNKVNQLVAKKLLERLGCTITVANDGAEAVAMFGPDRFEAIFMDCQMPKLDGYGATKRIRGMAGGGSVPIIALTANAMSGDREKCLEAGMDDYLTKPVTIQALGNALAQWCGSSPNDLPGESEDSLRKSA